MSAISPLMYVGGKTKKAKTFSEIAEEHFDLLWYNRLISPFCGGCSFEIYMANKYVMNVVCCDNDKRLIHFWTNMKYNRQNLIEKSKELLPVNREKYTEYYNKSFEDIRSIDIASLYYIMNRVSYCGKMTNVNDYRRSLFEETTPEKIDNLNNFNIDGLVFEYRDYFSTINEYKNHERTIFYLDPPYYIEANYLYGKEGSSHRSFNHIDLCELLKSSNINFILSYNDCPEIREMYKDYLIIDILFKYGIGKNQFKNELLIIGKKN